MGFISGIKQKIKKICREPISLHPGSGSRPPKMTSVNNSSILGAYCLNCGVTNRSCRLTDAVGAVSSTDFCILRRISAYGPLAYTSGRMYRLVIFQLKLQLGSDNTEVSSGKGCCACTSYACRRLTFPFASACFAAQRGR